jgi:hypothetical protein
MCGVRGKVSALNRLAENPRGVGLMAKLDNVALKVRKGDIAFCSRGLLGLITEDAPKCIVYLDGTDGYAFVGVHLTNKTSPIGSPWSSRTPRVVGNIDQFDETPAIT